MGLGQKAKLILLHEVPQLWAYYSPWQCNLGGLFLADNNPIGAMVPVAVSHTLFEISLQCNNRITFYFISLVFLSALLALVICCYISFVLCYSVDNACMYTKMSRVLAIGFIKDLYQAPVYIY